MTREWKPGDVAILNDRGAFERIASGCVVIDPECEPGICTMALREGIEAVLRVSINDQQWERIGRTMQAELRSLITPPRPEEPTGLGAVVEDAHGQLWVRDKTTTTVAHWKSAVGMDGGSRYPYNRIAAVKILNPGVTQ